MLAALFVPLVAVAAGTALSVIGGPRPRVLLPIRAFALAAVVTSVVAHLVPEAMTSPAGVWALLAFAVGLWLPTWLSHLRRGMAEQGKHRRIASELGFAAVLLHQMGDGVALGALGTSAASGHQNWDILLGILAHTVPLAAVVTLPFVERGLRAVMVRAALLFAATALGVIGAEALSFLHDDLLPWVSAAIAGTLLHILSHDEPAIARPPGLRVVEVLAMLAGAALPAVLASEHEVEVLGVMGELTLSLAPILLLGLMATILLRSITRQPMLARRRGSAPGDGPGVVAGFAAAMRAPSCACEVTASAQVATALSPAQLSFLLVAPELHLGTLLATTWLFGAWWTGLRAALAMGTAAIAVWLLRRVTTPKPATEEELAPPVSRWPTLSLRDQIAETFVHAGPWLAAGIVVASWLLLALPEGALAVDLHGTATGMWLPFAVAVISVLAYVCAWSATPVAAVLVAKGLTPELAMAGLVIGTITNREVLRALGAKLGKGAIATVAIMVAALTAIAGVLLGTGALSSAVWPDASPLPRLPHAVELGAAALLMAGSLLSLWRYGLTAWLEPLLADASGHHHHQHEEAEPCRDGCHEPTRPEPHELHQHGAHDHHAPVMRALPKAQASGGHEHHAHGHAHRDHGHDDHAHDDHGHRDHGHRDHAHRDHGLSHRDHGHAHDPPRDHGHAHDHEHAHDPPHREHDAQDRDAREHR